MKQQEGEWGMIAIQELSMRNVEETWRYSIMAAAG